MFQCHSPKSSHPLPLPQSPKDCSILGLVHWDDPEGWYGEGGGFRMGNTCIPVADHVDIWQNQYNIVKLKN